MKCNPTQVYDAINENPEAPNISFPDSGDEDRAIIDFHACEDFGLIAFSTVHVMIDLMFQLLLLSWRALARTRFSSSAMEGWTTLSGLGQFN